MRTFKIAKKSITEPTMERQGFITLYLSGGDVCMVVTREAGIDLMEGGMLRLVKSAPGNDDTMVRVCETEVIIKRIDDEDGKRYVYFDYTDIEYLTVTSFTDRGPATGEYYRYKCYFSSPALMAPGDFEFYKRKTGKDYCLYVYPTRDTLLCLDTLALCYPREFVKGKDITTAGGYCCDPGTEYFNYDTMERDSVLGQRLVRKWGPDASPKPGSQALFSTNPYYLTTDSGEIFLYPNVAIERPTGVLDLDVVLDQDYDAKRLFQEYQVNELFVNKVKSSVIPDFLDLEKVKYAPAFYDEVPNEETTGDTADTKMIMYLATGLTFNLHFRTRVTGTTDRTIEPQLARYMFEDTWHLDDSVNTWNNNGTASTPVQQELLYYDEDFVNSSNLLGYLGFTDEDVYNQKNRVKKTFIRLSFYDSENPLTQNLLYYSTIFLDSGELFGRFVKRKARLMDEDPDYDEALNPVVWSPTAKTDVESAVTSQLTVNDEYDFTKSGEGFNLYLFREDAPVDENDPQDIYMKVEFNHAGFGRTVPLIMWPKNEIGQPQALTVENYLKNLYIRVRIALSDRGYVYSFPDAVSSENEEAGGRRNGIVWENERLVLNLFEPRITPDEFEE